MNNKAKDNKWYVIFAKSPQVKEEWMNAFQKERERVKEDEEKGKKILHGLCVLKGDALL